MIEFLTFYHITGTGRSICAKVAAAELLSKICINRPTWIKMIEYLYNKEKKYQVLVNRKGCGAANETLL